MSDRTEYRKEHDRPLELLLTLLAASFFTWAATLDGYTLRDLRVDPPLSHLLAGGSAVLVWCVMISKVKALRSGDEAPPDLVLDDAGIHHQGRTVAWGEVLMVEVVRRFGSRRFPLPHVVVWCREVANVVIDPIGVGADAEALRAEIDHRSHHA